MFSGRNVILLAMLGALPGIVLRVGGIHIGTVADTALFGFSILAAAFLLAWASEASEMDIPQGVAVAAIALIAVLPEYAVDMTFAWKAGTDPTYAPYAVANMTGGNRLLIGAAWPLIFLLFWWRQRGRPLLLERAHSVEVVALLLATIYSFTIPLKGSINLIDTVVLAALFIGYVGIIMRGPAEDPELIGPAQTIGSLPTRTRRIAITALLLLSAGSIFCSAEPFAEGLIHSGTLLGLDEFLLVQWLAPLASEAPEFLVASILAWRGRATVAMGALLSSKVNQWTLLIGGLPIAFAVSSGGLHGLPLDGRQTEELFLTAAQSAFAVAVLVSLSLSSREALLLFALFAIQFAVPIAELRWGVGIVYCILALLIFTRERTDLARLLRDAGRTMKNPAIWAEEEEHAAH